jgi:hypothetical protein
MNAWLLLILSLPTGNATARMRCWRSLKASGAAVLRDGVYLLPDAPEHAHTLGAIGDDVRDNDGVAHVLTTAGAHPEFQLLFDRSAEWGVLLRDITAQRAALNDVTAPDSLRQSRKQRKAFEQLLAIDFFPGEAHKQAEAALQLLEQHAQQLLSPDEPHTSTAAIVPLDVRDYRGRTWATRARPWVDRLASAWLIRRFIDPDARFVWLKAPTDCPRRAIGFDFDGATFSHVGARVTFETLLASFDLETPPLVRLGLVVHSLDAGGVQPPEAVGVERVLAGMRAAISDDDQLLQVTAGVFEGLLMAFSQDHQDVQGRV